MSKHWREMKGLVMKIMVITSNSKTMATPVPFAPLKGLYSKERSVLHSLLLIRINDLLVN